VLKCGDRGAPEQGVFLDNAWRLCADEITKRELERVASWA
jgi:hypothetical protein